MLLEAYTPLLADPSSTRNLVVILLVTSCCCCEILNHNLLFVLKIFVHRNKVPLLLGDDSPPHHPAPCLGYSRVSIQAIFSDDNNKFFFVYFWRKILRPPKDVFFACQEFHSPLPLSNHPRPPPLPVPRAYCCTAPGAAPA